MSTKPAAAHIDTGRDLIIAFTALWKPPNAPETWLSKLKVDEEAISRLRNEIVKGRLFEDPNDKDVYYNIPSKKRLRNALRRGAKKRTKAAT